MSNVINKETLTYLTSVETSLYTSSEWIINPVLPECDVKFWKIVGDEVLEMTNEEKQEVLDRENGIIVDLVALKAEIDNDPENMGYEGGTNETILSIITSPTRFINKDPHKVPLWQIKQYALEQGFWWTLKEVAQNGENVQIKYAAATAIEIMQDFRFENIDLDNIAVQMMLGGLTQATILSQENLEYILSLGKEYKSRADELGFIGIEIRHIEKAQSITE